MNVLHLSDLHGLHKQVVVSPDIDMIIISGDASNSRDPGTNAGEFQRFLDWYEAIPVEHKIYVGGNHDTALSMRWFDGCFKTVTYLEDSGIVIDGINFWGSPWTPTFGNWSFMMSREKINRKWQNLTSAIDVLITHGPPKGVLDLTEDREGVLHQAGDSSLMKCVERIQPTWHCFGHLHNGHGCINTGTKTIPGLLTTFSNAAMVEDGKFEKGLIHQGIIFEI